MNNNELAEKITLLEKRISNLESLMSSPSRSKTKRLLQKKLLIPLGLISAITTTTAFAVGAVGLPHSFSSGAAALASEVNDNFSYIVARLWGVNGSDLYYSAGNVGIGTSAPNEKLEIAGDNDADLDLTTANSTNSDVSTIHLNYSRGSLASPAAAELGDVLGGMTGTGHDGLSDFHDASSISFYIDDDAANTVSSTSMPGMIKFKTTANGSTTRDTQMTIRSDGKVGIGTSGPSNLLHLKSSSAGDLLRLESNAGDATLVLESSTGTNSARIGGTNGISNTEITLTTGGSERVRIDEYGYVGIGTATPNAQLQVAEGDIYVANTGSGIVLRSPNGDCYLLGVADTTGLPTSQNVTCP